MLTHLTKNPQYLSMAESIFPDMAGGWDRTCGGGIWWSKDRGYKNAIANELFLSVAVHLANGTGPTSGQFAEWANKEWKWFAQSGMINPASLVNDGLTINSGHAAQPVRTMARLPGATTRVWFWEAWRNSRSSTPNPSIREAAQDIATVAITYLVDGKGSCMIRVNRIAELTAFNSKGSSSAILCR